MPDATVLGFGLLFVLLGLGFVLAARLLVRMVPKLPVLAQPELVKPSQDLKKSIDAVLVIERGGRVRSLNERGREVFHLTPTEQPDLEHLARWVRPPEDFLDLCAGEGQLRFALDGRMVDAVSYRITVPEPLMLLSLRYQELQAGLEQSVGVGAQSLLTFNELSSAMAASLDLKETVRSVLESVEKLIPADYLELATWDSDSQDLVPHRLSRTTAAERALEDVPHVSAVEGYSGYLFRERLSLSIVDVDQRLDVRPVEGRMPGLRSYLGIPLLMGKDFVGTLELGSRSLEAFHEADLTLVGLLSGQAAIALHNAMLYENEQRRSTELAGLSQLTQAISSVRDPRTLFARLVKSIVPLLRVEIVGFLIYNENQHLLEGQTPFLGLPDQFVSLYRSRIDPESLAEKTISDMDVLICENATEDEHWAVLGLDHLARAANLRDTVLVPLKSGGRMLGYLQVSNHLDGRTFDQSDLHLLATIASQAAPIIENAYLLLQSRQRVRRADVLRQIVSLSGSAANLDEILSFSLLEITRLLKGEIGAIFLLDPHRTQLQLHASSVIGPLDALPERIRHLLVDAPQFQNTVTATQRSVQFSQMDWQQNIPPFYQSLLAAWQVQSLIAVPLVVRSQGIGELWIASQATAFFDDADLALVSTAAGQLAAAVEQVFLRTQTDEGLRDRLDRLLSVTRISRELNNTLDIATLLRMIHIEVLRAAGAPCGSVLFFDLTRPAEEAPRVRSWQGDLHEPELSVAEMRAVDQASPLSISDFKVAGLPPPHAGVLSALLVPLVCQQRVVGLIVLHGTQPNQFTDTDQDISQSLAIQSALALGNAIQYEDHNRRSALLTRELDTLAELLQVSQMLRPSLPLEQSLTAIGSAIRQATPFQVVVISVCDFDTMMLRRVCSTGLPSEQWEELASRTQSWQSIQSLLLPEFRLGNVYYIPIDKSPVLPADIYTITLIQPEEHNSQSWDPDDFLLVPLYDSNSHPLGLISVDVPSDGRKPDRPTYEALELFGIQASLMIENHLRTTFLEKRLNALEVESSRLQQSTGSATQNLPIFLRKDLEQTVALQGLNRRVERIRATLDVASQATAQPDSGSILQTLARELLARFALQCALIAEKTAVGIRLVETVGTLPAAANPEALFGQRNPLRSLLMEREKQGGEVDLVANLESHPLWTGNPLLGALQARAMILILLNGGGESRFGLLLVGRRSLPPFSDEDRRIFVQLARQVSVGLQNLHLLTETQRRLDEVNLLFEFSSRLGSLEAGKILSSLVESVRMVLPAAQAGWVSLNEPKLQDLRPQISSGYLDGPAIGMVSFRLAADGMPSPLPLRVLQAGHPLRAAEVNFTQDYQLKGDDLLNYRKASQGRLPDSCLILPLRLGEVVKGVLMLENFDQAAAFSAEDEGLAFSFCQQAALALDNARLYQASQQRAAQMHNLTQVSNLLTSSLNPAELVGSLLGLLEKVIPYDAAILWVRQEHTLVVRAARGFEESDGLIGITVKEDESVLFSDMVRLAEPMIVPDVRQDERFPSLVEALNLSWMGLPLVVKGEIAGMIAMEKRESGFYSGDQAQVAATFASQAAVAMENARLFEESQARTLELQERSQRLALLNRISGELGATLDINDILEMTAHQLVSALNTAGAAGILVGPGGKFILELEVPGRGMRLPQALLDVPMLERLRETQGLFVTADAFSEQDLGSLVEVYCRPRGVQSLLIVPLISGTTLHGWLMLDRSGSYRFSLLEIELARTVCNQAATAIQNALLFEETRSLTEFLERRVEERTGELRKEHKNSQTLLRVISELSTSLDMGMVLARALKVLNESFGSQESAVFLIQEEQKPHRAGERINPDPEHPSSSLPIEREIARWTARHRKTFKTGDVVLESSFPSAAAASTVEALPFRSILAIPLMMGEEALGSLLMYHAEPNYFKEDQVALAEATARQLGIAINNAELFNLIRDQSEHLGKMLREQQIEASRSRAILEAVADGVVVTDDQGSITLVNASAERILGLKGMDVAGQPLDQFSGIFGRSGSVWLQTIHVWMRDPRSYQGEVFADQFELDNGSIIAVSLSPVLWRAQFLGTVSIFRDITHEVQLDRLKSEFVANVSHELRTPMTSIKGYVEIMLLGATGEISPQQRHFLEIVKSNTERLGVLVNDLLDVSRIESGRVTLSLQSLNLREIAEDVIQELKRRSQEENKPMEFALEIPADLPALRGDAERIRQVLGNLVTNGYNYTPQNGRVTVSLHATPQEVQVDVCDTGIGIHPGDQHRIFERFYRGEDPLVLATAGTGLGLAIARTLVEMHHGRIWFKSSGIVGEGSVFSFTLPMYDREE